MFEALDYYQDPSLQIEGFIHCSYLSQVEGVLGRYYGDAQEVVLLTIDTSKLSSPLRKEAAKNGEVYPHIYGDINKSAIVEAATKRVNAEGIWVI